MSDAEENTSHDTLEDESLSLAGTQAIIEETDEPLIPLRYGFRVGGFGFILAQEKFGEVMEDIAIHPIPNTQKWFLGMVNMRGNLVPVFDYKLLLNPGDNNLDRKKERLMIMDSGDRAVGVIIDELPKPVDLGEPEERLPDLPEILEEHVGKAYDCEQQIWLEFDIEGFFEKVGAMAVS